MEFSSGIQLRNVLPRQALPKMIRVLQRFETPTLENPLREVHQALDSLAALPALRGKRIAVAVGSRGICQIPEIARTVIEWLKKKGAEPFIIPAMGSHGGATASGQAGILAKCGITEERMGVPIVSSMDVVEIARTEDGLPVYIDKNGYAADYIVLINRVKPHTQFRSSIESGLLKMMAIGLGKDRGASLIHAHGVAGLVDLIPRFARLTLATGKILFGLAMIENAEERIAEIRALGPDEMEEGEKKLLARARGLMPTLPVDTLDFLIIDEIGKEISGPGMDSSITGRIMAHGVPDPEKPDIRILAALDLTAASLGNAVGIGVADLTTDRLIRKLDRSATYINTLVGGFPEQGKLPMFFRNDRELLMAAALLLGSVPFSMARVIRIKNTLKVSELLVSESLIREIAGLDNVQLLGEAGEIRFDDEDLLISFDKVFHE